MLMIKEAHGIADSHFLSAQSAGGIVPDADIGAVEIDRDVGGMMTTQVVERECRGPSMERLPPTELDACLFEIQNEARQIALTGNNDGRSTIRILRSLLEALA